MNVPLYAAALFVFALFYEQFDVPFGTAILVTLAAMAVVLGAELAGQARHPARTPGLPPSDPDLQSARSRARRIVAGDAPITAAFVVATWGIFAALPRTPGSSPLPALGTGTVVALVAAASIVVAILWYEHDTRQIVRSTWRYLPYIADPVLPMAPSSCLPTEPFEYAFGGSMLEFYRDRPHRGEIRLALVLGANGQPPRRFGLCDAHLRSLGWLEIRGRHAVARKGDTTEAIAAEGLVPA